MEVYSLPFSYHLESADEKINYFLVGNVGYSRVYISKNIDIPPNSRLNYDNHLRTYTGGLGGGIRYKATPELNFLAGIELIYSRSGASVKKPDDGVGDAIEDFFNKSYNDNLSYNFFTSAQYRPKFSKLKPYIELDYELYQTKSSFTFDELSTFHSESSVVRLALGAESNKLLSYNQNYLTLEGYLNANYLSGAVKESIKLDSYLSVGAVAYWYTPNYISWIERFFTEVSSIQADGLEGYNIGVGFTVEY